MFASYNERTNERMNERANERTIVDFYHQSRWVITELVIANRIYILFVRVFIGVSMSGEKKRKKKRKKKVQHRSFREGISGDKPIPYIKYKLARYGEYLSVPSIIYASLRKLDG